MLQRILYEQVFLKEELPALLQVYTICDQQNVIIVGVIKEVSKL